MEMNFCRRCGTKLKLLNGNIYECENGHTIFLNPSPGVGLLLTNDKDEVLVLERALEPGKGSLDAPGGFCDLGETLEEAVAREILEETGIKSSDYTKPEFILSATDPYLYSGEEHSALGCMFTARMLTDTAPKAADDAASARFTPIKDLDLEKIYFPSVRAAYTWLKQRQ